MRRAPFILLALAIAVAPGPAAATGVTEATAKSSSPPYVWHTAVGVEPGGFTGLACPSTRLCVATDNAGGILTSRTPTVARTWNRIDADGTSSLAAVACPTSTGCVAVDSLGNAVVSTEPAGERATTWKTAPIDPRNAITALSCPTRHLCVAVDGAGNAITTTAPFAAKPAWTVNHIDPGLSYACQVDKVTGPQCQPQLLAIACPAASLCVATDDSGYVIVTHDPGAKTPKWTVTGGGKPAGFNGISCPTSSFCALVNGFYAAVVTINPRRPRAASTKATLEHGTAFLNGVNCPSVSVCLLESGSGGLFVSTNPTGPATAWVRTPIHHGGVIDGVACQPRWCIAMDGAGHLSVGDRAAPGKGKGKGKGKG